MNNCSPNEQLVSTIRTQTNTRIYDRNIPSQMLQPYLDVRPVMTKYSYLPIVDPRKQVNTRFEQMPTFNNTKMFNPGNNERFTNRLYLLPQDKYPELNEDLVVTGGHSILVDEFEGDQREKTLEKFKEIYITDDKYRLIAEFDDRAAPYNVEGEFNIYHFALENDNYYYNYGVYANGLLVETCSKRYLTELSNMKIL